MDVFTEHFLYWRLMQTAAAIMQIVKVERTLIIGFLAKD